MRVATFRTLEKSFRPHTRVLKYAREALRRRDSVGNVSYGKSRDDKEVLVATFTKSPQGWVEVTIDDDGGTWKYRRDNVRIRRTMVALAEAIRDERWGWDVEGTLLPPPLAAMALDALGLREDSKVVEVMSRLGPIGDRVRGQVFGVYDGERIWITGAGNMAAGDWRNLGIVLRVDETERPEPVGCLLRSGRLSSSVSAAIAAEAVVIRREGELRLLTYGAGGPVEMVVAGLESARLISVDEVLESLREMARVGVAVPADVRPLVASVGRVLYDSPDEGVTVLDAAGFRAVVMTELGSCLTLLYSDDDSLRAAVRRTAIMGKIKTSWIGPFKVPRAAWLSPDEVRPVELVGDVVRIRDPREPEADVVRVRILPTWSERLLLEVPTDQLARLLSDFGGGVEV